MKQKIRTIASICLVAALGFGVSMATITIENKDDFNTLVLGMLASMEDGSMLNVGNNTPQEFTFLKYDGKYWKKWGNLSYMVKEIRLVSKSGDTNWNGTFELFSILEKMKNNNVLDIQQPPASVFTILLHNKTYWNLVGNNTSDLKRWLFGY